MTNICFFSGDITRDGGTERVASIIANELSFIPKYNVTFLSLVEQKNEPFYAISSEIKRYVLRQDGKWVSPGFGYMPFVPALRKFLKEQKIDILIDIDIVLDVLSLPASAGLRTKVISWEHFHYDFEQSVLYRKMIIKLSACLSDYMVTLTEHDKLDYQRFLHRKKRIAAISNPLHIIPTGITRSKEKMLITVGRLEYEKGTDMLINIIPKVLNQYRDWEWYFLGDGEYRKQLQEIQKQYMLEDRLVLPGVVKNVEEYLKRASLMVMASRSEGFSMSILEARACMVPCIAFDVPVGPAELIKHGRDGFLIHPFDLDEMKARISRLIEDQDLRERFSYAVLEGLERYKPEVILKEWMSLLDNVMEASGS